MRACWTAARRSLPPHPSQRALSNNAFGKLPVFQRVHPCVRDFAAELSQTQPCFQVRTQDIRILSQPKEFLDLLMDMIRRARRQIFLSSLYIGPAETYIIDALEDSLKRNPTLHVHLHLDYNRSTRPGPSSTVSLLIPLLERYPDRIHAHLFKSPKLKGLMEKLVPRRVDEGWGTWHAKVYGADDEVLISGANLNDSYFTNRQDRYLHFKSPTLSRYCRSFLREMEPFCFKLYPKSSECTLQWPTPSIHPQRIEDQAGYALQAFQDDQWQSSYEDLKTPDTSGADNILIFPVIQAGQFGMREEERTLDTLFRHLNHHLERTGNKALVDFTSGYFSLSDSYQKSIQASQADYRLLCASPKANGFLGSKGISGRIPEGYTFLEQQFWRGILQAGRQWNGTHGVQFHEWVRKGWTYHAKGLWVSPYLETSSGSNIAGNEEAPVLTMFGSTNFNSRSANLDTELAFVMVIPSEGDAKEGELRQLRERLRGEINGLRSHAVPWQGERRHVKLGTRVLVNMVGGML